MADGTTYTIDMAAEFASGDAAISQLEALADKLTSASSVATSFDSAIAAANSQLAAATTRASEIAAALSQSEAAYAQLERSAVQAWTAVERASLKGVVSPELTDRLNAATTKLRDEGAALDALRSKSSAANAEQEKLSNTIAKLTAGAKAETAALNKTGPKRNLGEDLEKVSGVLNRFGGRAGQLASQGTQAAGSMAKLAQSIGVVGAAALATVAVIALVVAGVTAATIAIVKFGIETANAARDAKLTVDAMVAQDAAFAKTAEALPAITRATGQTQEALLGLAKTLKAAKVSAADMPIALRAAAQAETALGKGGSEEFLKNIQEGKKSVSVLADEVDSKFGGIVAKRMLGLSQQAETAKRNIGETFGGLKIEGFLEDLSKVTALFDQNTESGKALKFLFETLVQPLVDSLSGAGVTIEAFVLGIEIQALKTYIAFMKLAIGIEKIFGIEPDDTSVIDWLTIADYAGRALVATIAGLAIAFGIVVASVAAVPVALGALEGYLTSLIPKALDLGKNLVLGLANGITNAASAVIGAITGVVTGAIDTAKKLLGIHSPSTVFAAIGGYTAEGFEGGISDGTSSAHSAVENLVLPPVVRNGAQNGTAGSTARASSGATFNLNFNGVAKETADAITDKVRQIVTELLETDAMVAGA